MDSTRAVSPLMNAPTRRPTPTRPLTIETTSIMKKLLGALIALPMFLAAGQADASETHFGEYKVKIHATNAEKWKVRWLCNEADGSTTTIDSDTYPASKKTTRATNITSSKCSTGDWKIEFQIKSGFSWVGVKPGGSACAGDGSCGYSNDGGWSYKQYARPSDFNSSKKLCMTGWNMSFTSVYLHKGGC